MVKIDPESWKNSLMDEFNSPYFQVLKGFLQEEKTQYQVYPPGSQIFAAFDRTPFDKVKVVILGQDPYHGKSQAHGLCFSVPYGIKAPPSLINIFKEIYSDLQIQLPSHGNLESWASQGVFLLNATLTVRASQAGCTRSTAASPHPTATRRMARSKSSATCQSSNSATQQRK